MTAVAWVAAYTSIAFLWHNLIGAVVVFGTGMIVSEFTRGQGSGTRDRQGSGTRDQG
jgi:acetylglutamate kinase